MLDALDPKGRFVNFLEPQVGIVSPNKERMVVDLEQVAPGRYLGRFPAAQEGVYLVGMSQRPDQSEAGSQLSALVVPYAQELRELGVDEAMLKELSEVTGGGAVTDARDVFEKNRRSYDARFELWTWLVALGATLLLFDIALRRLGAGFFIRATERARRARSTRGA